MIDYDASYHRNAIEEALQGASDSNAVFGVCCYGGMKRKTDCASCSAWKELKTCAWAQDQDDGSWDTGCGNKFCIENGTPEENEMRFCCYCGAALMTPNPVVSGGTSALPRCYTPPRE